MLTTTLIIIMAIALIVVTLSAHSKIAAFNAEIERILNNASRHNNELDDLEKRVNANQEYNEQALATLAQKLEEALKAVDGCMEKLTPYAFINEELPAASPNKRDLYLAYRMEGLSVRKAGEQAGVSYSTAKRYEKKLKEQKANENSDC